MGEVLLDMVKPSSCSWERASNLHESRLEPSARLEPGEMPLKLRPGELSRKERGYFFRSLALLVEAGIPMATALEALSRHLDSPGLKRLSGRVLAGLARGDTLHKALTESGTLLFSSSQIGAVKLAEESGSLTLILHFLADEEERFLRLRARVAGALTYPAFVLVFALVVFFLAPGFLLHDLLEQFRGMDGLHWPTRLVIAWGASVRTPVFWGTLALVVGVLGVRRLTVGRQARLQSSYYARAYGLALRLPGLGAVLRTANLAIFSRMMALLLGAGVLLDKALTLAAASLYDPVLRTRLEQAAQALRETGRELSHEFAGIDYFPASFLGFLAQSEECGGLEGTFRRLSRFHEEELEHRLEAASALLEPLAMALIGLLVGFLVLSMALPMAQLVRSVS